MLPDMTQCSDWPMGQRDRYLVPVPQAADKQNLSAAFLHIIAKEK